MSTALSGAAVSSRVQPGPAGSSRFSSGRFICPCPAEPPEAGQRPSPTPSPPPPPPGYFFRIKNVTLFFSSSTSVNIEKRALASQARQPRRESHFNINEIV